jgi:hypothetical protein
MSTFAHIINPDVRAILEAGRQTTFTQTLFEAVWETYEAWDVDVNDTNLEADAYDARLAAIDALDELGADHVNERMDALQIGDIWDQVLAYWSN